MPCGDGTIRFCEIVMMVGFQSYLGQCPENSDGRGLFGVVRVVCVRGHTTEACAYVGVCVGLCDRSFILLPIGFPQWSFCNILWLRVNIHPSYWSYMELTVTCPVMSY